MSEKKFICGDEAVALGAKLARPQVIAAYPITPQTIVVERLSDYVEDGSLDAQYLHVESEHSAMCASIGAASVGARTFTATSSQGLLYMVEGLYYASGARFPIVMMDANRSLALPWNIYGDQRDSLSQLASGWIQWYAEDAQEALDMTIQAFKVAEDPEVMLPVMVCLDGFVLTHTYEVVDIPDQELVDKFIPYQNFANKMDLDNPTSNCITVGPDYNLEFHYQQHVATIKAGEKFKAADAEYNKLFGRSYGGLIETYKTEDADAVIITLGSVTGTTRCVVDSMREQGKKVGLLKLRCMRPFPSEDIREALQGVNAVGVLERDIDHGCEGVVYTNVNSALIHANQVPKTVNFIGGLGGRSILKGDIEQAFDLLLRQAAGEPASQAVNFVKLGCL
jgi:pyruvate ferredoxin oxidoreductase alpha subunit